MKHWRNFLLVIAFAAPAWAALPAQAGAQALPDPVVYQVAPENPGPNQAVLIEAQGVGQTLGNATIVWSRDGKVVQQGPGESSYTFTTGPLGSHTNVTVTIQSSQGTYSHTFDFSPSLINLVWEADTTVPPFYKGKALYSAGSPIKVVALPVVYAGSARVAAGALSYQWSLNDDLQQDASGLGRSSFAFVGSQLNAAEDVSVDAYYGAAKVAHGEVVIPATDTQLVLYQHDPLRGLLLDIAFPPTITLTNKEIAVQAVPFYFSNPDNKSGQLTYAWQLNGNDATGPDASQGILTLRQTGSGGGVAQVSVSLQDYNSSAFVQGASAALNLLFGQNGSLLGNLFGL